MIKKIFFYFISFIILMCLTIYLVAKVWFYLSFPFIEAKTKARFGDDFFYVYDQSKGEYGNFPPSYVCTRKFSEIPKEPLFERVVMFKLGFTDWGSARRYMSKGAFLIPLHFGVVDRNNDFYYWSYFAWDYIKADTRKVMGRGENEGKVVYIDPGSSALGRIGKYILDDIEKCRAMPYTRGK